MYSAQPNGADSATINPAALASADLVNQNARGTKRSRSPESYQDAQPHASAGDDGDNKPRKRGRPMKSKSSISDAPGHPQIPPMSQQALPPHTPQSQNAPLPGQAPAYTPTQASPPAPLPKATPTKSTLKALPTVRDHTTDQLGPGGDEYLPREIDDAGEKKVQQNGQLTGGREYRCRTFLVPNRGDKLFMLATECARVLGYRDSYLLFNKNRSLFKIIANQVEKDDLVSQEILPFSYRSRQIAIVTARSMFRQFGSRVIVNGRRVRDDYWEGKARKQGFTEADPAGEKRPGASKAREAAAEAANNIPLLGGPHGEIVYSNQPGQFGGAPQPQVVQPEFHDNRAHRDYANIIKSGPRQEITGPPYQDRSQPSPISEIHAQAHHAAEFNRTVNSQRDMRNDYMQNLWRRPHEQPASAGMTQPPVGTTEPSIPTSRPAQSPHTTAAGLQQPGGILPNQSPQMMMTAAPYSQPVHAQNPISSTPMRGMAQSSNQNSARPTNMSSGSAVSMAPSAQSYSYPSSNQMWGAPQTPQTPQHAYSGYTTQPQQSHPQQSPAPQLRHPTGTNQVQAGSMQYPGMQGMGQNYGTPGQGLYTEQTPRQYLPQNPAAAPAVTQAWSNTQNPQQWWTNQPQ